MAHMIENNMMSYVGETPWHGLGVEVPEGTTGEAMMIAAKLDWTVEQRSIAMGNKQAPGNLVIPGFKAVVRADTQETFAVMSEDRYHVVQNAQIIELFSEYCAAGHATMETVGGLYGGRQIWALARLNGGSTVKLGGVDEVRGYLLLSTSHDGSLRTTGKATQVRVVCHNTLTAALNGGAAFKLKHSAKWTPERAQEAQDALGMASEQVRTVNAQAAKLADVHIDHSDWLNFMSRLMGGEENVINPKNAELTRIAQAIHDDTILSPGSQLVTAQGTLWGAVNGVTYYADHTRGRTADARLSSAWFGDSDCLKSTAMKIALDMAGVAV